MRKGVLLWIVTVFLVVVATPASAHGGEPQIFTDVDVGLTGVDPAHENPCTGDIGLITVQYNSVSHVTLFPDGHYEANGILVGSFTFDPADPELPDGSGTFADPWSATNSFNTQNVMGVNAVISWEPDGSRQYFIGHFHMTVVGTEVIVVFTDFECRSGEPK